MHNTTKKEFLTKITKSIKYPYWTLTNFDALEEALRDFHWITEQSIHIEHTSSTPIKNPEDQKIYLEILLEAKTFWAEFEDKNDKNNKIFTFKFPREK